MPPRTPDFWYSDGDQKFSLTSTLLQPLSYLYGAARAHQSKSIKTKKASVPVICTGNLVAGGTGKTPSLIAINHLIAKHNLAKSPYFLTRGYGGTITGTRLIDVQKDKAADTGDEPQILCQHGKTIISANRYAGATLAQELGGDLVLMDDGFQNVTLHKDISFLVIDGKRGFGNGRLIPSGPLREPIAQGLARTHAVIFIGHDAHNTKSQIPDHIPIFDARIIGAFEGDKTIDYYGFAGLGDPWKFKTTLLDEGIKLKGFEGYADHHRYSLAELNALMIKASDCGARLITTQKDYMRIPDAYHDKIDYYPVFLDWANEAMVVDFLNTAIKNAGEACA